MVVQHNLTAMNSNRMLNITTNAQAKSTEKLSSGYKINRAADNAAGLSISEKMRKQIRGLTQASSNAQDGISTVQTAEGALGEVQDMLQRMNELAVQSANGTNSSVDRAAIQDEVNQLVSEIDRVSTTTKFNETYLLSGDSTSVATIEYKDSDVGFMYTSDGQVVTVRDLMDSDNTYATFDANGNVTAVDVSALWQDSTGSDGTAVAASTDYLDITDTAAMSDLSMNFHVGADSLASNKITVTIEQMSAKKLGIEQADGTALDLSTEEAATASIDAITDALQAVSDQRAALGAVQNRLEHTINNLDNVVENTTDAESSIRDTDMATEMVTYSNNNILAQAGQAMLAQANQANQGVLSLLG